MTFSSRLRAVSFPALFLLGFAGFAAGEERRVPGSTAELTLSYAPIVQRVAPAVVNVYAAKVVENPGQAAATPDAVPAVPGAPPTPGPTGQAPVLPAVVSAAVPAATRPEPRLQVGGDH